MTSPRNRQSPGKNQPFNKPHGPREHHAGDKSAGTGKKRFLKKKQTMDSHGPGPGREALAGVHCVREALKAGRRQFHCIHIADNHLRDRLKTVVDRAGQLNIPVIPLTPEALDDLCPGVRHQGIVAIVGPLPLAKAETVLQEMDQQENNCFVLVLESMEDPHNLGALIRTALCAGVNYILLPRDRAVSPTPAVSRASAGALEHAPLYCVTNTATLLRSLKKKGFWVAGLDAAGEQSLFQADFTGNIALVVGGEHKGIRPLVKKECDFLISLPMARGVTSLNASVAGGIAMYEVLRQRG
ncbi:23S rRNA (guanosine2251-2'-O)-methyltransferase [Desulfocicer vacuolatum DSM 3385]|uniref:23S rRNA (Guanosine2251-2'-O)-methyltransferase n=1 Tax=Desulfocicer vacuolatum DSM 3385 TaxID=1121400 RepID=A0A1W1Z819_9BACT|nr:23S rRNA (guanosine(2251)-2'-O)-methyltransferase RlmB [Desulfocicer vacuolatum]SMC44524.1 23S rRNA (guanosine2251-2'-O)-methyltransferase [Desulfocicer vacuolatum DSM 3385]